MNAFTHIVAAVSLDQDIPYENFKLFRASKSHIVLQLHTKRFYIKVRIDYKGVTLEESNVEQL
jgi:hypothetical protein